MKTLKASLLALLLSANASAALLNPEGLDQKMEKISLPSVTTTTVEGEAVKLNSVGKGLRNKKVVFVNVKVYIGQFYVSTPQTFKKSEGESLGSIKEQKAVAMQLHFLRDVDAENVQKSFKEALKVNNIDTEDAAIKQFLTVVSKGGEAQEGKTISILGAHLKDGSDIIFYENTNGSVSEIKGPAGLIEKVFAIWLGKPADDGVAHLKKSILK